MYFYELREGDDDLFSDLILVNDTYVPKAQFFELVQQIRRRIQDTYEDDTLIEAVAGILQRDHGYTYISDDRLVCSVNVSAEEADNFVLDPNDETAGADFRGILLDWEPESPPN